METEVDGKIHDADASCSKYSVESIAEGTAELKREVHVNQIHLLK